MRTNMLLASLLLASCYHGSQDTTPPPKAKGEVRVDLASINLGDDCGSGEDASAKISADAAADMAATFACVQTTMQLQIMNVGDEATSIRVKRVELLDAAGRVLDDLTARAPTHWDQTGSTYVAWDQVAKGGQAVQASYPLIGLDWDKVPGGRWEAHTKTFTLRVTVTVGTSERTVEKKATAPAMIEPDVVT